MAAHADRVVAPGDLVDALWPDEPPRTAIRILQVAGITAGLGTTDCVTSLRATWWCPVPLRNWHRTGHQPSWGGQPSTGGWQAKDPACGGGPAGCVLGELGAGAEVALLTVPVLDVSSGLVEGQAGAGDRHGPVVADAGEGVVGDVDGDDPGAGEGVGHRGSGHGEGSRVPDLAHLVDGVAGLVEVAVDVAHPRERQGDGLSVPAGGHRFGDGQVGRQRAALGEVPGVGGKSGRQHGDCGRRGHGGGADAVHVFSLMGASRSPAGWLGGADRP